MRLRIIVLFTILKLYLAHGETQQCGGCGFGFEILLAKLEAIEERLIALEAKWENAAPRKVETEMLRSVQLENEAALRLPVKHVPTERSPVQTGETAVKVTVKPDKSPKYPVGIEPTAEQLQAGEYSIYSSCREVPLRIKGKNLIRIPGDAQPINLLFNHDWIVVQHRFNGSESFYRNWADYEAGFGNLDGEFWLGLQRISSLVNNGRRWLIMFWLTNFEGQFRYAMYDFKLGTAVDGYELKQVTEYMSDAGDSFSQHVGMKFSTYDRDNDPSPYNCAKKHRGGWWYHQQCVTSNLNGLYGNRATEQSNNWLTMKPSGYGVQASKIMIRELII